MLSVLLALTIRPPIIVRIRFGPGSVRANCLADGTRLVMAFSTASSTATMPVTYVA